MNLVLFFYISRSVNMSSVENIAYIYIYISSVAYPETFLGAGGGGEQIQLTTEGRENRDRGAVAP
jgi:hypothetical protein